MQIDVGASISELLYECDAINIPGLGGFVASYQPAAVDQAQGQLRPPAKDLTFNSNLVLNDGLLAGRIRHKYGISAAEAEDTVHHYVQEIKEAIARREIVVFPKVGRLYLDYEQKLQFLSDGANFDTGTFGLPAVSFYPIARMEREQKAEAAASKAPPAKQERAAGSLSASITGWFQQNLPLIGVLTLVLVTAGAVLFWRERPSAQTAGPDSAVEQKPPAARINQKPSRDDSTAGADTSVIILDHSVVPPLEETPDPALESELDTEASTPAPNQKSAVIAIGLFGDPQNVERISEQLLKAGFEPYLEEIRGLTRIGVQLAYEKESELEQALISVQEQFSPKAFVLRKEGGR